MGVGIENGIGFLRMFILYILTGLGGNLLSMDANPPVHGVGASTAIFGLVGFYIAYIFSNWQFMGRVGWGQRIFLVIYTGIMAILNSNIGPGADPHVDGLGHLGGMITGGIVGFAISEQYDADAIEAERTPDRFTDEEYKARSGCCAFCSRCGLVTLIVWFLTLFIWFYCLDAESIADDESGI